MTNPISNSFQANNQVDENFSKTLDKKIELEKDKYKPTKKIAKVIASILLSLAISGLLGYGGYTASLIIRKATEKAAIDVLAGVVTFIVAGIFCWFKILKFSVKSKLPTSSSMSGDKSSVTHRNDTLGRTTMTQKEIKERKEFQNKKYNFLRARFKKQAKI